MKQGIVIPTWSGGQENCKLLLKSIWEVPYPVLIVLNDAGNAPQEWRALLRYICEIQKWQLHFQDFDGYELGGLQAALDLTDWDEIIILQDTMEIKNPELFRILFKDYAGRSIAYNPHFQMYFGKFRREILNQLHLPIVRNKIEAIRQEELFTRDYWKHDPSTHVFNPHFRDENFYGNFEVMFGRNNLKLEDDYIIKRKGTWTTEQIPRE